MEGVMENELPQGSVLSPTLSNIAVHDINEELLVINCMIYADDLTLWASDTDPVHVVNNNTEIALNKISQWCSKWSITISLTKYECTLFIR